MYEIIKGCQGNDGLRNSFNTLATEIFRLNFEDWYQNGFWGENYIPYSIVIDEKIVANVSVNITNMRFEGNEKRLIQLGTVMTAKEYRNKGLIRRIMEEIERDFEGTVDGMYLFANDSVLEFYPKFGFKKSLEYQYEIQIENISECQLEKIVMNHSDAWKQLQNVMKQNNFRGKFDMIGNHDLNMFYVTKFMREDVYYHKESDTFIIAEIKNDHVMLHNIFSNTVNDLDTVISWFGKEVNRITFGFTPANLEKCEIKELKEDDTTFFTKGKFLDVIAKEKLRIPSLAHA